MPNPPKTICNKLRCKDEAAALAHLDAVRALNGMKGRERQNRQLHVYHCPSCRWWHVGHKPRIQEPPGKPLKKLLK